MAYITTSSSSVRLIPEICSHEAVSPGHRPYVTLSWSDPEDDRGDVTVYLELDEAERVGRELVEIALEARAGRLTGCR